MRSERPVAPLLSCTICIAAVVLGPLIAVGGDRAAFQPDPLLPARPKLQLWLATVSGQALCWAFLVAWMLPRLRRLARAAGWGAVLGYALAPTLILAAPWLLIAHGGSRAPEIARIAIAPGRIGLGGLLVAGLGLCGMFLEYRQTMLEARGAGAERVALFGEGLSRVHQFLFASGLVLGLGTIGASALRGAIEAEKPGTMPPEYVAIYGIFGSLLMLAAYGPVRWDFYRRGERAIAEACAAMPAAADAIEKRAAMESLLGNDAKSWFGLGGVVSSLLPLVLATVGKLLEK